MARIVRMEVVAPDDVDFEMPDGTKYRVSGDIPLPTMLRFAKLEQRLVKSEEELADLQSTDVLDEAAYEAAGELLIATLEELQDAVLGVLRVHTPGLAECPFSQYQIGRFLAYLRGALDDQLGEDELPPTTTPKTGNRAARRASPRSTGSTRSPSSTAGLRTPGKR